MTNAPIPPATTTDPDTPPVRHGPFRVVVTGSSGAVGRVVVAALRNAGHVVRGFDRVPQGGLADEVIGDVQDAGVWSRALQGFDTLVHLAATPDEADFMDALLGPNVVGTYRALEAAGAHGLRRVVLASTMQVVTDLLWGKRALPVVGVDDVAPRNHYGLTKAWAEEAGRMAARVHGLSVVAARIGWFPRERDAIEQIRGHAIGPVSYVSHRDTGRFFVAAVEADFAGYGSFWCMSRGTPDRADRAQSRYDLLPGREVLGYDPVDVFPQGSWFGPDGKLSPTGDGSPPTP